MKKKQKNTALIAVVCLAMIGLMVLGGTNLSSMAIYGENQIYTGSTFWCGVSTYKDGVTVEILQDLVNVKVYAACASGPARFEFYRLEGSQYVYKGQTELTAFATSWEWVAFSAPGVTLSSGSYFIGACFQPAGPSFGITAKEPEPELGETSNAIRFSNTVSSTDEPAPSTLPGTPSYTWNKLVSLYVYGDPVGTPTPSPSPTPVPTPPPSPSRVIIPSLQSGKYAMRGYGGFESGYWTTSQYKFVRVQFYSLLEADGNLVPHSNWATGSEGGGNWAVVQTVLQNIHNWGGIPDLSIWIDNIDQTIDGVPVPTYTAWYNFFTRLKTVMQATGTTELCFEPAWEWNGVAPVSPAHMRSPYISPGNLNIAFTNIRTARDAVGIQVTVLSHMLAVHGAEWNTPAKRGYMEQWFPAMQQSDAVTVSLYLTSSSFGDFSASDWSGYLNSIYTYVIAEQMAETGWSPATYIGFSEHNLQSGTLTLTETSGSLTGQQIYDLDFSLATSKNVRLMGWWLPFSSSSITSYVNNKAATYQSGGSSPTPTPAVTSTPSPYVPSATPTPPPDKFSHPAFSSNAETKNNELYKSGYPYVIRTFSDVQANYTIQSLNFDYDNKVMTIIIDGVSGETATFVVDVDGQSAPFLVSGAEDWSYNDGTVTLTVKFASPVTVTMLWESLVSPEPRVHDYELLSDTNIILALAGLTVMASILIFLRRKKRR